MSTKVLVVFYSTYGHVARLAQAEADGAAGTYHVTRDDVSLERRVEFAFFGGHVHY